MCAKNCVPYLDFDGNLHYNNGKISNERTLKMKITPIKIAVTMVLGVLATVAFGNLILYVLVAGLVASIIYSIIKRRIELCFLILAMAFTIASLSYGYSASTRNHPTIKYIDKYVTLTGEITTSAQKSAYSENYRYDLRLSSITNRYGEVKTNETILLTTPQKLNCGSVVIVRGIIDDLPQQMNENGFDTATHYKSRDVFTRIFTEDITVSGETTKFNIRTLGGRIAEFIDSKIYKYYQGDGAAILSAILTGNTHHFSAVYKDVLSETTFSRFFHPAYLHIWIILAVIGLLKKIVPRKILDMLTVLIFIAYAMLQTGSVGFSRCLICAAAAIIYRLRYGSAYYPDTMATVVTVAVVTTPTIIFHAGFVLSVLGGMLIWAFAPPLAKKLKYVPKFLRHTVAVILVCIFLYTPLSMCYFSGLCIYSFILPIITAPLIICTLISAPIALLLLELCGTAPVFAGYTDFVINTLYKLPYFIEGLPLSHINIATPSVAMIVTYLSGIFLLFYFIHKRRKQILIFSALFSGLCISLVVTAVMRIGTVEFTFVNVDQGDGAVIHTPYRETVVIDGGGGNGWSGYNPGEVLFVPYLEAKGYNRIEVAIVSHYHQDHIEGIVNMIDSIKTDVVFAPAIQDYYSESMLQWAKRLKEVADANGTKVYYVSENTRIAFGDGLVIDIYAPDPLLGLIDENDTTMPIKASYGEFSVLYTGDMTNYGEYLFMNNADVSADVLKVGHHGSRDSSTADFIAGVNPIYSVISCGIDNTYGHPHSETLERLKNTQILRTDLTMDIKITARKDGSCRVNE